MNDRIEHLSKFWIDGRQHRCSLPAGAATAPGGADPDMAKTLRAVEDRLGQTLQALESFRRSYHTFLTAIGMLVAVEVIYWIASNVYDRFTAESKPPKIDAFAARR